MTQGSLNCKELQGYLELQLQKFFRLRPQDSAAASGDDSEAGNLLDPKATASRSPLPKNSGDDVHQGFGSIGRGLALWKDSMEIITEEYTVPDIVAVIDTICETLTTLLDAGYGYKRFYVLLLEALLKLLTALKDVERQQPDFLRSSGIFNKLNVSVSITYAVVEKVSARLQILIFFSKFRLLTCTTRDTVLERLIAQLAETRQLRQQIVRSFEIYERIDHPLQVDSSKAESSHAIAAYGVNKLTVAAHHYRSLLLSGEKATFLIHDSQNRVVYTVQTWLNNPAALFHSAKRLSACVKCNSGKVFNIGVPGYPNKEADPRNKTALIICGFEEAQVRTFLPLNGRSSLRNSRRKAGALLENDKPSSSSPSSSPICQKCAGELLVHSSGKSQKYTGEIELSKMILKFDYIGQTYELRRLSLEGKKCRSRVWYKCCVEVTGEVLAIYRQRSGSRIRDKKNEGIFHLIGIGNQPEMRDLIICSFVAMGLNSYL